MSLVKITFTGADDQTDIEQLKVISTTEPRVEWGILFLSAKQGFGRFPSFQWITEFTNKHLPCAAHLCEEYVDEIAQGNFTFKSHPFYDAFQRIQLNFHGKPTEVDSSFYDIIGQENKTFIFQIDDVNNAIFEKSKELFPDKVVPLFDLSHGAGILPDSWPTPYDGVINGYAGGLGVSNINEQLHKIAPLVVGRDYWIDCETKMRTSGKFDLVKVASFIAQVKEWEFK